MTRWGYSAWRTAKALNHAMENVNNSMASAITANSVALGRHARRSGILAPGDAPPSGAHGTFWDFRNVLCPKQARALEQGTFPIGRIVHPQRRSPEFPVSLEWGDFEKHIAIIGPPGSGKSRFLIAPWIIRAAQTGLTTINVDVKGDLLETLSDAKHALGSSQKFRVRRWDIADPAHSRSWNPIGEVRSIQDATQVAQALLGPITATGTDRFFAERDHRWVRGLLRMLSAQPAQTPHPRELYRMAVSQPYLLQHLVAAGSNADEVRDMASLPAADYSAATAGLANRLSWLADPTFADMLSGTGPHRITVDEILTGGGIFVVGARMSFGELAWASSSMILSMLKLRTMEHFGAQAVPVLWTLDEAGRYAERIGLQEMLDLMRGAGSSICLAVQDVQHLGDEAKATAIISSCDALFAFQGVSPASAAMVSARLGSISAATISQSADHRGGWQPTVSHQMQPILGASEIMTLPMTTRGVLVHLKSRSSVPFIVDLAT